MGRRFELPPLKRLSLRRIRSRQHLALEPLEVRALMTAVATTTTLGTSNNSPNTTQSITLTATIASTSTPSAGSVTFFDNGVALASGVKVE